ncbi:xanthine dehydrogenase [Desulfobacter hydrogenophilus]|uniref:Xanthine dehydrogenase n=1 Tax=Desulfobacter hydrogenophilus TaxID=2291 RepID=A0A328FHS6_9BACT|nr:molybdopterin cofactor-binding domain-containing protein [Desulfobacter hydrogenophilus]NDY70963.1 molybdopterin-dependent oxidoreductase [Desulfobacter hydrogenophilus]QBH12795.1 xanthine dehydrogenase [Desulfobacter hydrogenophilus]RAM03032.1 xanthine dehydrogenase [Desulfobacter hydrogenophilus]
MINPDTTYHVMGLTRYVDDRDFPARGLHCVVFFSPLARGKIRDVDTSAARDVPGVAFILTAKDIPGVNQIGGIIPDEVLLAEDEVVFVGMPVAAVYAWTEEAAREAVGLIKIDIAQEIPVLDPREAYNRNELIAPVRTFTLGDVEEAIASAAYVAKGRVESGAQEHFYLEGQVTVATPSEEGNLHLSSGTQAPTSVQRCVAKVCGLAMNRIEVDVRRLGGAFGGKEVQANTWACFAALGAQKSGVPCRMVLRRSDDMLATGKRHPYSSDFTLALDGEGNFLAFKVMYYQNAGAAADLSTSILERTLFHATGSYYVPNVHATAASCRTNITPNTAFRGFGGPQGMFVFESAIREASRISGIRVETLQRKNLLKTGDFFAYGMAAENAQAQHCWDRAYDHYDLPKRMGAIDAAQRAEKASGQVSRYGKGYALMPVCFGISFTTIFLNQARAHIHVYTDGSVGVSTGAVEMGQGVNHKIREIVVNSLGIAPGQVKLESTNTTRVSNTSPTAASSGTDLNGAAALMACEMIKARLFKFMAEEYQCTSEDFFLKKGRLYKAGKACGVAWEDLVIQAYGSRVQLSAEAHYATPDLFFDTSIEKGRPFAYHTYGTAYFEAEVDRLLGTYRIEKAYVVHDLGRSINPLIDLGQVEGGMVQGIGWMTMEEMRYAETGRPLTATAGTYKMPDISSVPLDMQVKFLEDDYNDRAVKGSKAVGEPPFMYGIGAFFAIKMAAGCETPSYCAPMTPERLFGELRGMV